MNTAIYFPKQIKAHIAPLQITIQLEDKGLFMERGLCIVNKKIIFHI